MLPKILRNFNVFVDGRGYAGKIDEITLPKLTIKTEEYRAGGMDIPINIDMGMEKLEADFTFAAVVLKVNRKIDVAVNKYLKFVWAYLFTAMLLLYRNSFRAILLSKQSTVSY